MFICFHGRLSLVPVPLDQWLGSSQPSLIMTAGLELWVCSIWSCSVALPWAMARWAAVRVPAHCLCLRAGKEETELWSRDGAPSLTPELPEHFSAVAGAEWPEGSVGEGWWWAGAVGSLGPVSSSVA